MNLACLPEIAVSTPALLLLLMQMCDEKHAKKDIRLARSWRLLLEALFTATLPAQWSLTLRFDRTLQVEDLEKIGDVGFRVFELPFEGVVAKVGGIAATLAEVLNFRRLFCTDTVDMFTLFDVLDSPKCRYLLSQVALGVALVMERALKADEKPLDVMLETAVVATNSKAHVRRRFGKLAKSMHEKMADDMDGTVCKYFFCARKHFDGCKVLSFSTDASRMGKKQCLVSAISKPNNVMMWAPPTVLSGYSNTGHSLPNERLTTPGNTT
jgi:hypothetical protein